MADIDCGSAFERLDVEDAEKAVISGGDDEVAHERQLDDALDVEVEGHEEVLPKAAVERIVDAEDVDFVASAGGKKT